MEASNTGRRLGDDDVGAATVLVRPRLQWAMGGPSRKKVNVAASRAVLAIRDWKVTSHAHQVIHSQRFSPKPMLRDAIGKVNQLTLSIEPANK